MMKKRSSSQEGFTLYELLVVAGIILLLVSIILSSLDVSRAKARDTKKVSELRALQTAIELYQLDNGYPKTESGERGLFKNSAGEQSMSSALDGIVDAGYISAIPTPPKGSAVLGIEGIDTYYYQTEDVGAMVPSCDGKALGEVPYIIYFITEQPRSNLPTLRNGGVIVENGHCFTL